MNRRSFIFGGIIAGLAVGGILATRLGASQQVALPDGGTAVTQVTPPPQSACDPTAVVQVFRCTLALSDGGYADEQVPAYVQPDAGLCFPGLADGYLFAPSRCVQVGTVCASAIMCKPYSSWDGGWATTTPQTGFRCVCASQDAGPCLFVDGGQVGAGSLDPAIYGAMTGPGCLPRPCDEQNEGSSAPPGCIP